MEFNAEQIAAYLQGQVEGDPKAVVTTFAKIEEGVPGAITFLSDIHYEHYLYDTKASVVLVNKDFQPSSPVTATLIRVEDARACVARLLTLYQQAMSQPRVGIHPQACVGENVVIGDGSQLYAGVVVEERATVGENCILYPNVSVYHDCHVGNRVILHSGCCIGSDGFGFAPVDGGYEKIPQIGNAIIEDDVEIGANSCVDRAVMGSTYVRKGVKLDNLVQIAHNCDIGENTVMSAQVGVAGSTKIGQWCMFGGQVGIAGHIEVADRTRSGAQAGIAGKVRKSDQVIIGSPAMDARQFARCSAVFKNLPELWKDVNDLKRAFENK